MINASVKRFMIDIGNSTDILYFDAFLKFRLPSKDLISMASLLTRFIGNSISPLGIINVYITLGDKPCSKMVMTKFLVVDIPLTYIAIIVQSILNRLRVVTSTYHIVMKFSTRANVGELRSDPKESH